MDSRVKLYLDRAENEFRLAQVIFNISRNNVKKLDLGALETDTFYSSVISHAYYCIFYSTKALLLTKDITTNAPEEHKKTLDEFKKVFVDSGLLDLELLKIYNEMIIRADELLSLFQYEKRKRGQFTYKTLPQANMGPAEDSIANAKKFLINIKQVTEK